ncbi:MAG TPA: hypothetical protein PKM20_08840, partial [Nitrosomonas sp.]|nr:hypothetical protein [Nitrosomonas sp.]
MFILRYFAIHCNKQLLRSIALCPKKTSTHSKYHPTKVFRLKYDLMQLQANRLMQQLRWQAAR